MRIQVKTIPINRPMKANFKIVSNLGFSEMVIVLEFDVASFLYSFRMLCFVIKRLSGCLQIASAITVSRIILIEILVPALFVIEVSGICTKPISSIKARARIFMISEGTGMKVVS